MITLVPYFLYTPRSIFSSRRRAKVWDGLLTLRLNLKVLGYFALDYRLFLRRRRPQINQASNPAKMASTKTATGHLLVPSVNAAPKRAVVLSLSVSGVGVGVNTPASSDTVGVGLAVTCPPTLVGAGVTALVTVGVGVAAGLIVTTVWPSTDPKTFLLVLS